MLFCANPSFLSVQVVTWLPFAWMTAERSPSPPSATSARTTTTERPLLISPVARRGPRVHPGFLVGAGQGLFAENMVRRLLAGHDRGPVEIAVGDVREDRRIRHPQPFDADHPALGI